MRSFILKAAVAAVLVSTSLTGAYAANRDHDSRSNSHRSYEFQPPNGGDNANYFNHMTMGPAGVPSASPPVAAAPQVARMVVRHPEFGPRIARVDRELGAANRRIAVDRSRGYLTAAEEHALHARSHNIKLVAQRIATRHEGALPAASYAALQNRIVMLDRSIHRDATT